MAGTIQLLKGMNKLLLDTSILVDYLRNKSPAVNYVEATADQHLLSAVVVAELYGGVRSGTERAQLDALIAAYPVLPVTERIAGRWPAMASVPTQPRGWVG